jgi:hypothetical protein
VYSSSGIIRAIKSRRMRWVGHIAYMDKMKNAKRIFIQKPEGKISLGRTRCRWEDNINMDLKETVYEGVD